MTYFVKVGDEAWVAYLSGGGLTNCEWLILPQASPLAGMGGE